MAKLRPSFRAEDGTVTAGYSSPLNDGAAALLPADEEGPRPRTAGPDHGLRGVRRRALGLAPVEAVHRALGRAGRSFVELTVLELDGAVAAQVLGCVAEWPGPDPSVLDPRGGAIAIGARSAPREPASWAPATTSSRPQGPGPAWRRCASARARAPHRCWRGDPGLPSVAGCTACRRRDQRRTVNPRLPDPAAAHPSRAAEQERRMNDEQKLWRRGCRPASSPGVTGAAPTTKRKA